MLSITNQDKLIYEAPTTSVFEVKTEGVICQSPGTAGVEDIIGNSYLEE